MRQTMQARRPRERRESTEECIDNELVLFEFVRHSPNEPLLREVANNAHSSTLPKSFSEKNVLNSAPASGQVRTRVEQPARATLRTCYRSCGALSAA